MQREDQRPINPSRRSFLRVAGQGALAAGLAGSVLGIDLAPPDKQPPDLKLPGPRQKKLGFAIVGIGELALGEILPAFETSERCQPVALVSGHRDKAEKVAEHYGIDPKNIYNYENYDSIRDNPAVDVIYIVLPNTMHAEYTVRGFKAGKHVLCEKPMGMNEKECQQMIEAGKSAGKKLMIAYRLHYEPYNKKAIELAQSKKFGPIRMISADNYQNTTAPNIRLSKATGGGPLSDVGIYCVNACRYITGEEPQLVSGLAYADRSDPRFAEVPSAVEFMLQFPSGVVAHCSCGFNGAVTSRYSVTCAEGGFELNPAYKYHGIRMHTFKGEDRDELEMPDIDQFAAEMDHFAECIEQDKTPLTPGEEGLKDIRVLARISQSIEEKRVVEV